MLVKVDTVRTPCTTRDFIKSCARAWFSIYKTIPLKKNIAIIYAQNSLETGNTYNMYNWNLGNLKAVDVPGQTIEFMSLNGVWEIVNGVKVVLQPTDPGAWFRAFKSLDDGMISHFDLLKNHRYKNAWSAVKQGDPANFAHILKQAGYYTAPEQDYVNAMNYNFRIFMNGLTFDAVMLELTDYFGQVDFPSDYKPVDSQTFNVIDDTISRPMMHMLSATPSWFQRIKNLFQ